jgi:hypothetical protein
MVPGESNSESIRATTPSGRGLNEERRAEIRAEEIYRAEVRAQLDNTKKTKGKRLVEFLNSPLGIYLLSSILLSGITYLYTQHKTSEERKNARNTELSRLRDEIAFRERQVDEAFANVASTVPSAQPSSAHDADEISNTAYRIECEEISGAIRLGGIVVPPGDLTGKETRWRDLSIDNDLLLYRQGYKYPEYKYLTVEDLGIRTWRLTHDDHDPAQSEVQHLSSEVVAVDKSAYALMRKLTYSGPDVDLSRQIFDVHTTVNMIRPLLNTAQRDWQAVTMSPLLRVR